MKIISNYKDYYDFYAANRLLSDQSYRWERKPACLTPNFSIPMKLFYKFDTDKSALGFVVCFCGRLIPCLCIGEGYTDKSYYYGEIPDEILSMDNIGTYFKKQLRDLFGIVNHPWGEILKTGTKLPRFSILEMHRKLNSPVFLCGFGLVWADKYLECCFRYNKNDVVVNPRLKDIGFEKFMNGFDAFKELDRFVSNELAPIDNRVVVIPDKLKAESHGFDKFSFRKDKQE